MSGADGLSSIWSFGWFCDKVIFFYLNVIISPPLGLVPWRNSSHGYAKKEQVRRLSRRPSGHGGCGVPMNRRTNAGGSIDETLPSAWRVASKRVYPRLKAGDAIDASILMHWEGCMPQAASLKMKQTVSTSAVLVLASIRPVNLLAEERKDTFQLRKELTCITNLQEIALAKEAARKDRRRRLVEKWQTRCHGEQSRRYTYSLIPELATWLNWKHGQVGFYLAQALSGHGCFNAYLRHFKKRHDESCPYCGSRSGDGCTAHSWHDDSSHAPVWRHMDAHQVLRQLSDEDEGLRWA